MHSGHVQLLRGASEAPADGPGMTCDKGERQERPQERKKAEQRSTPRKAKQRASQEASAQVRGTEEAGGSPRQGADARTRDRAREGRKSRAKKKNKPAQQHSKRCTEAMCITARPASCARQGEQATRQWEGQRGRLNTSSRAAQLGARARNPGTAAASNNQPWRICLGKKNI